jgi:hypothetical protein
MNEQLDINSNMENQALYATSIVMFIATISCTAYSVGSVYSAYGQLYSDSERELVPVEEQQPLEAQQPLEKSLAEITGKINTGTMESIVQAPKEEKKSVPFILPFDSGSITGR